jgi:hypothetical protein
MNRPSGAITAAFINGIDEFLERAIQYINDGK